MSTETSLQPPDLKAAETVPCGTGFGDRASWRLVSDGPLTGEANMRADAELLEAQKSPGAAPVLRFFQWREPAVSYGRLQDPVWAEERAKFLGAAAAVRRPTGGGLVFHKNSLSLSLAWRRDRPGFPKCLKNIYRAVHELAAAGLRGLGVATDFQGPSPRGAVGVCFDEPVEDDLMWRGRKILGGALRVTGWGRLYQGDLKADLPGLSPGACAEALARIFTTPSPG